MTEAMLHRQVADFLALAVQPPAFWTTFPAGHFKGKAAGGRLKGAGLKPGCPDILLIKHGQAHWIELKTDKGKVSPAQAETGALLMHAGCPLCVCRSVENVQAMLSQWGFKTRAEIAA